MVTAARKPSPAETIRAENPLSTEEYLALTEFPGLTPLQALERITARTYQRVLEAAERLDQIGSTWNRKADDLALIRDYFRVYYAWTAFVAALEKKREEQ